MVLVALFSISESLQAQNNALIGRFEGPSGYQRIPAEPGTFAQYLRNIPLKPAGSVVQYYDGRTKNTPHVYCAVVDMPIGNRDLVQCADAVMLLRGDYLFQQKRYNDISFHFVSDGQPSQYSKYTSKRDELSFRKYMNYVFANANTRSLYHQLKPVTEFEEMQIGDVFIQTGNPYGHAVILVDMAEDPTSGKKVYMLAQSYMPAQEIQILRNPMNTSLSPWYELKEGAIRTPEWQFVPGDLRRF
jgi:hypothetical protein